MLPGITLIWLLGSASGQAQSPKGAILRISSGASSQWTLPATVELVANGTGQAGFGAKGGAGGIGSNGKPERGSPNFSTQVENGATFYACDLVTGFPAPIGNRPSINRKGGSSFIAVKTTPKGNKKVWICASVGAYRIVAGTDVAAEWEYQIRYYSGDPDAQEAASTEIGTVPNSNFFGGSPLSGVEVEVRYEDIPNFVGSIGTNLVFRDGYHPGAVGTVSVMVTNAGPGEFQGALDVSLYISPDASFEKATDTAFGTIRVDNLTLGSGQSELVSSDPLTLPKKLPPLPYYFIAVLDPANAIKETNENDNVSATLALLPSLRPDLSSFQFADARPGRTGVIDLVIWNRGSGPFEGGPVDVEMELQFQGSRLTNFTLNLPAIEPGKSITQRIDPFVLPKDLIRIPIDPDGQSALLSIELDPLQKLDDLNPDQPRFARNRFDVRGYGIAGKVVAAKSHLAVEDAKVGVYDERTFNRERPSDPIAWMKTDSSGDYLIEGLPYGNYIVYAQKRLWVFSALDDILMHRIELLDLIPGEMLLAKGTATVFEYFGFQKPELVSVSTEYPGTPYFLAGIGLNARFDFEAEWGSQEPGKALLQQNGETKAEIVADGDRFSGKVDVGHVLDACVPVTVKLIGSDGVASEEKPCDIRIIPQPDWPSAPLIPKIGSNPLYYKTSTAIDLDFIKLQKEAPPELGDVPFIANSSVLLEWFPKIEVELLNDKIKAQFSPAGRPLSWTTGLLPKLGAGRPVGEVSWKFDYDQCEWNFVSAGGGVTAQFEIPKFPPVLITVIPTPIAPVPLFSRPSAKAEAGIKLLFNSPSSHSPVLQLVLSGKFSAQGTLEIGFPGILSGGGFVELQVTLDLKIPPFDLTNGKFILQGGFVYNIWIFRKESTQIRKEWIFARDGALPNLMDDAALNAEIIPIGRDYLARQEFGNYSEVPRKLSLMGPEAAQTSPFEVVLQKSGFPESSPYLCETEGGIHLAWTFDDANRSSLNRTVVAVSRRSANGWDAPQRIWEDGTADFHPHLAATGDGSLFAVWEDLNRVLPDQATLPEMVQSMEISVARYDAVAGRWVQPQRLSENATLDRTPRLASDAAGVMHAFWIANSANSLIGSAQEPNRLMVSSWDPNGWTAGEVVATVPYGILYYDVIAGPGGLQVVLSVDQDGNLSTYADRELYLVRGQPGQWSQLTRLTDDGVPDDSPQFVEDADGTVQLVWLKGGELSSVTGFDLSRREVIYRDEYSSNLAQFRLNRGTDGRLGAIWAEPSTFLSDIRGVFFDPLTKTWSGAIALTQDAEIERSLTGIIDSDGRWVGAYNRLAAPIGGSLEAGGGAVNLPWSEADLVVREVPLGADVALLDGSLRANPVQPQPGTPVEISFTVGNRGAWPVANLPVAIYQGDPTLGGVEIGRVQIAELGGGREVSRAWTGTPSGGSGPLVLYVVADPANSIGDLDRSNNSASLPLMRADLAVETLYWKQATNGGVQVFAEIVNLGVVPGASARLELRSNTDGTNAPTAFEIPALGSGERKIFSQTFGYPSSGGDLEVTAAIVRVTHEDFDLNNHEASLSIQRSGGNDLKILSLTRQANRSVEVKFRATIGTDYILESTEDLRQWTEVKRAVAAAAESSLIDDRPSAAVARFYRLRKSP